MLRFSLLCAAALALAAPLHAQSWETLTDAPMTTRYNDLYFVSPDLGWAVNGSASIYRTTDGGGHWEQQFSSSASHLRSVAFLDSLRGWAGNVGVDEFRTTDPTVLYGTDDGGETWVPVSGFEGPAPVGLCGMYVLNDSVIVAVGRVRGPSVFVRTIDGGESWQSKDMSEYAAGLIDVYFTHPDSGLAVGLTDQEHSRSRGVVLATTDGGETWEERFTTSRTGEWNWKLSFPSRRVGYASLQRNSGGPVYFLKTTDGGLTWEEKLFSQSHYFVQGIGFVSETNGWIGGNSTLPAYETTDGGDTWRPVDIGYRLNRFRFLNDSLGYAAGSRIHKFEGQARTGVEPGLPELRFSVAAGYPNPFDEETTVPYTLSEPLHVTAMIFDLRGRQVRGLADAVQPAAVHEVTWDGTDGGGRSVAGGVYFCVIRAGGSVYTRPVLLIR